MSLKASAIDLRVPRNRGRRLDVCRISERRCRYYSALTIKGKMLKITQGDDAFAVAALCLIETPLELAVGRLALR